MAALVERELATHNKPNLHVSIVFVHSNNSLYKFLGIHKISGKLSNCFNVVVLFVLKIQDGAQGPVLVGKWVPIQMTKSSASVPFHSLDDTTFR